MEREKALDEKSRNFLKSTEIWAGIAGLTAFIGAGWVELRDRTRLAIDKTAAYDAAKEKRDLVRKGDPKKNLTGLTADTPDFVDEFVRAQQIFKEDMEEVHKKIGISGRGLESLKLRFKLLNTKSNRMGLVKEAATVGFMAATLVVGLGIITRLSDRQDLKEQLDAKQPGETAMKM